MFDYDTFSDLHKDVHGFRPSAIFMKNVKRFSDQERDDLWEALCAQLEENTKAEKAKEEVDIAKFEARVLDVIGLGADDRETALRWITGQETFYSVQCVEHFVWEQGILFTDYGKALLFELLNIVEYKEYDYA
tara:strand:- start:1196 stop:1594 length:399 start_codon:yes stop_codon:yes gene_type:complete